MVEEQAQGDAKLAPTSNKILYVVSLNHLINDGSTFLIAALFPAVVIAFHFSELEIGILVALGYVMNMIFQPLTGKLSERYEARALLAIGIGAMAGSMLLFTISSTFPMMLVSVLILRFGSSFYHPVGVSAVSESYGGKRLDGAMGFQSSFGNLGVMIAFALSAPLYLALGWKGPFLIYAAIQSAIAVLTLLKMSGKTASSTGAVAVLGSSKKQEEQIAAIPRKALNRRYPLGLPLFFILATFITGGSYSIFSNFGNLFLVHNGFRFSDSDYLIAIWVAAAFVGAIQSGYLTRKLTRRGLLLATYFLAGVSSLTFAYSYHNIAFVVVSLLVSGYTEAITYPAIYSELAVYVEKNSDLSRGFAFGVLFSSQIAGSAVFGILTGYIADAYTLQIPFIISTVMLLAFTAVVYFWRPTELKTKETPP